MDNKDIIQNDSAIQQENNNNVCLEEKANFLSKFLFFWPGKLVTLGNKKYLEENDLFDIKADEKIYNTLNKFKMINESKHFNYLKSLWALIRTDFIICSILSIISSFLLFSGPLILSKILNFLSDQNVNSNEGYYLAIALFLSYLLRNIIEQHSIHRINHISIIVNNSIHGTIFQKILKMTSSALKDQDVGKILNLINVDSNSIYSFTQMMMYLITSPVILIISMIFIFLEVGVIGLVGPILLIFGIVLQNIIQKKSVKYRKESLKFTDERSKYLNEFFSGIKIIKYYAWENIVFDKIQTVRKNEVSLLFKQIVLRGMAEAISTAIPILISIIVFSVYYALGNEITPSKAYTVLSLFNLLQMPLRMLSMVSMMFASCQASLKRLDQFSNLQERTMEEVVEDLNLEKGEINIEKGDFVWELEENKIYKSKEKLSSLEEIEYTKNKINLELQCDPSKFLKELLLPNSDSEKNIINENKTLISIDFKALNGELIAIVGQVGSGKTSFLNALLGEINCINGLVKKNGSIAYVPQSAWLMNASIRDNILFGKEFNEKKYDHILKICELESDLMIMPGGDLTEIGERGVNLSGGQKQRVSLARAIYDDADIYIIDDCIASLDAHVGKKIFENVLKRELANKTVIFVTNALQYLSEVSKIVVFRHGKIVEYGTSKELIEKNGEYVRLNVQISESQLKTSISEEEKDNSKKPKFLKNKEKFEKNQQESKKKLENDKMKRGSLIKIEERSKGSVPWKIYLTYISSGGGIITFFTITSFIFSQLFKVGNDWWLGVWSEHNYELSTQDYILIYSGFSLVSAFMVFFKSFLFGKFSMNTAQRIQKDLLRKLLRTPMWWFDINPNGRILSRTTKDQDSLDIELPWGVQASISSLLIILSSILVAGIITPFYPVFAVIGIIIYILLIRYYIKAAREIKRIDLSNRSPVISHFSETCQGIFVIRSFKKNQKFLEKFYEKSMNVTRALQNFQFAGRWIANYSEIFGSFLVAGTAFFSVLSKSLSYVNNPALIGFALSSSFNIVTMLSFTIRILANTESQMTSVQRIIDYIENNPSEKEFETPIVEDKKWPMKGQYEANNLTYKYRKELENVIRGISFSILENEKIGVVGRTGSGKSTLILGILRIIELNEDSNNKIGNIILDNINIADIGLHELRKKLTIIPQDPTLFTGTIRFNIDPYNEFNNLEIIDALKKVHIWETLNNNDEETETENNNKLNLLVTNGGSNFSLGQRQLLCMARALIKKTKILLMDEATASIDEMTDQLIQKMIRTEFKETTVITIAHRLHTIIEYDKIMVMSNGRIVEFDSPKNLIANENSHFFSLIKDQGLNFKF